MAQRRKTKYTPETAAAIVAALHAGATHTVACRSAGISTETFYAWIKAKPDFAHAVALAQIAPV